MNATPDIEASHNYQETLAFPFSLNEATRSRLPLVRRRVSHILAPNFVAVEDCWVLNTAVATRVEAHIRLLNRGVRQAHGNLRLEVVDPRSQRALLSITIPVSVGAGQHLFISRMLTSTEATVWTFDDQNLFQMVVSWDLPRHNQSLPLRRLDFAFLEFAVEGFGRDEMFRLRNRKSRLSAVLPWSRWTSTGLSLMNGSNESAAKRTN